MNQKIIEYYQNYFNNYNPLDFSNNLRNILTKIDIPFESKKIINELDIPAVMEALDSGYKALAFAESRFITQVDDYKRAQIILSLLPPLREIYQEKNIIENVFWNTLSDISLRINLYISQYGKLGLTRDDGHWLLRIFFLSIFKLGGLQFETLKFNINELELPIEWTDDLSVRKINHRDVLSVHIMAKSNLSEQAVKESFQAAELFFKYYFPQQNFKALYCASWFLYPDLHKLLDNDSRILSFAKKFKIIGEAHYPDHAIYSIFQGDLQKKATTSLEIRAQKHPEYLGVGIGIIPIQFSE